MRQRYWVSWTSDWGAPNEEWFNSYIVTDAFGVRTHQAVIDAHSLAHVWIAVGASYPDAEPRYAIVHPDDWLPKFEGAERLVNAV